MSRVTFYEITSSKELRRIERRINGELSSLMKKPPSVRLFLANGGKVGFSIEGVAVLKGKQVLDRIHRTVTEALGYRRGRPPSKPTHQVKCRVPEDVYQRLVLKARRKGTTPSKLLFELVNRDVG